MVGRFRYYKDGRYDYSGGRTKKSTPPEDILSREINRFRKKIPKDAFKSRKAFARWYDKYFGSTTLGKNFQKKVSEETFWNYIKEEKTQPSKFDVQVRRHRRAGVKRKLFVKSYERRKPKKYSDAQLRFLDRILKKYPKRMTKQQYEKTRLSFNKRKWKQPDGTFKTENKRISAIATKIRRMRKSRR